MYAFVLQALLGHMPKAITVTVVTVSDRMVIMVEGDAEIISLLRDCLSRTGSATYMEIE